MVKIVKVGAAEPAPGGRAGAARAPARPGWARREPCDRLPPAPALTPTPVPVPAPAPPARAKPLLSPEFSFISIEAAAGRASSSLRAAPVLGSRSWGSITSRPGSRLRRATTTRIRSSDRNSFP